MSVGRLNRVQNNKHKFGSRYGEVIQNFDRTSHIARPFTSTIVEPLYQKSYQSTYINPPNYGGRVDVPRYTSTPVRRTVADSKVFRSDPVRQSKQYNIARQVTIPSDPYNPSQITRNDNVQGCHNYKEIPKPECLEGRKINYVYRFSGRNWVPDKRYVTGYDSSPSQYNYLYTNSRRNN